MPSFPQWKWRDVLQRIATQSLGSGAPVVEVLSCDAPVRIRIAANNIVQVDDLNSFGDQEVIQLATRGSGIVEHLILSRNQHITDACVPALQDLLSNNQRIRLIDLRGTSISADGISGILSAIESNDYSRVATIKTDHEGLREKAAEVIQKNIAGMQEHGIPLRGNYGGHARD
ncbi:MAG: hypothetical protein IT567_04870 [Alphaproteobacteria bacterium]|nr:hypothetical protein [Alphaproteobacteria bacterium]